MGGKLRPAREFTLRNANSSRLFVTLQGMLAGFCGIVHGYSEALKGNIPTESYLLASVGAFTILPNYLITGVTAILVSFAIALWTLFFIHRKHGPAVFLALAVLLFLVGGGVAQVVFFIIAWGVSTRIRKPLTWWNSILPCKTKVFLAKAWPVLFAAGYLFVGTGIGIWLFVLPPGVIREASAIEYACWISLGVGLILQLLTIVAGFARDIERQSNIRPGQ